MVLAFDIFGLSEHQELSDSWWNLDTQGNDLHGVRGGFWCILGEMGRYKLDLSSIISTAVLSQGNVMDYDMILILAKTNRAATYSVERQVAFFKLVRLAVLVRSDI